MRKWILLLALGALGLLPSATKANTETYATIQAAKPVLKCPGTSIKLVGTSLVATGGCKIGIKSVPAKWTWIQKSADLSGSPCQFGSGKGIGKRSNLLVYPAEATGPKIGGSTLPGLLDATFTVTARWGKQTVKVRKSFHKTTPDSHVLCGAPPKLVSLDGPTPSALTWAIPPTFDGTILRTGTVESRGNGQCRWLKPTFQVQGAYLTQRTSDFVCANGYSGHISFNIYYATRGEKKCSRAYQSVGSFAIPPSWGSGFLALQIYVVTFDSNNEPYPYVSNDTNPNSYNLWNLSYWAEVFGNVDPCITDLR